jgi:uncharacterized protein YndB with AHSA1/START domain
MDTQFKLTAEPCSQEIITTCLIDAPREMVFNAFMDPGLLERWWGPKYLATTVDVFDACSGGSWRFLQHDKDGNEYAFHGVFHSISSPDQIVQTFEFEGTPGHVILDTIFFEDVNGKTRITDQSVFQSPADRDAMLAENMESGASESMVALAEMMEAMKKATM